MKNEVILYLQRLERRVYSNNQRLTRLKYESKEYKRRLDEGHSDRLYRYRMVKLEAIRTLLLINNVLIVKHNRISQTLKPEGNRTNAI